MAILIFTRNPLARNGITLKSRSGGGHGFSGRPGGGGLISIYTHLLAPTRGAAAFSGGPRSTGERERRHEYRTSRGNGPGRRRRQYPAGAEPADIRPPRIVRRLLAPAQRVGPALRDGIPR